jgi:hypothetical protein
MSIPSATLLGPAGSAKARHAGTTYKPGLEEKAATSEYDDPTESR